MKKVITKILVGKSISVKIMILCLVMISLIACKKSKPTSEPTPGGSGNVSITGLSSNKLHGLMSVTITGTGFSTTLANNKVTFNTVLGTVSSATSTSITVIVPVKAGNGKVRVQVGDKLAIGPDYEYELKSLVTTLAGSPGSFGFKNASGNAARFSDEIMGLKLASDGNLYLAEKGNYCIRKITADGIVSTFAGTATTRGLKNGVLLDAEFGEVFDITEGPNNTFYVTDGGNYLVRKITKGQVDTFAGSTKGFVDGQGTNAKFDIPFCIARDFNGNIYIADQDNHCIRKITVGGMVSTLAGSTLGYLDGKGTSAKFMNFFGGLVTDSKGDVFVSDSFNNCIRKITPDGTVSTYAGVKGESSFVDGPLSTARIQGPGRLAIDANDNIYFADFYKIRKISVDGIVTTIAGTAKEGKNDGLALEAQFSAIVGLAVSSDGTTIYIADSGIGTIRKLAVQ